MSSCPFTCETLVGLCRPCTGSQEELKTWSPLKFSLSFFVSRFASTSGCLDQLKLWGKSQWLSYWFDWSLKNWKNTSSAPYRYTHSIDDGSTHLLRHWCGKNLLEWARLEQRNGTFVEGSLLVTYFIKPFPLNSWAGLKNWIHEPLPCGPRPWPFELGRFLCWLFRLTISDQARQPFLLFPDSTRGALNISSNQHSIPLCLDVH